MQHDDAPPLDQALRDAVEDDDPLTNYYVDRRTGRVVTVRDGYVDEPGLEADEIEDDERRFVEAPLLLPSTEHLWRMDFVDEIGERRVSRALDHKQGAAQRFVQRLAKLDPDLVGRWRKYRRERITELVADFMTEHDLTV